MFSSCKSLPFKVISSQIHLSSSFLGSGTSFCVHPSESVKGAFTAITNRKVSLEMWLFSVNSWSISIICCRLVKTNGIPLHPTEYRQCTRNSISGRRCSCIMYNNCRLFLISCYKLYLNFPLNYPVSK